MEKTTFSLTGEGENVKVDIEGTGRDLVTLIATAIYQDQEIEHMLMAAFLVVAEERSKESETEDNIEDILANVKPYAQA